MHRIHSADRSRRDFGRGPRGTRRDETSSQRPHQEDSHATPLKGEAVMTDTTMERPKVVSREEWFVARKQHLAREKEFNRLRDQLSAERRQLPWVKVDKPYVFDGPNGKESLADLFDGRSQL